MTFPDLTPNQGHQATLALDHTEPRKPLFPLVTIIGNVPSKSNSYKIINLPGPGQPVDCPDCNEGKQFGQQCPTCFGSGVVELKGKTHASLAKTKKLLNYERDFSLQAGPYKNKNIEDYFGLWLRVYYDSERPDLDGCLKIILDCLQKIKAVSNDRNCIKLDVEKMPKDAKNPRIELRLFLTDRRKKLKNKPSDQTSLI